MPLRLTRHHQKVIFYGFLIQLIHQYTIGNGLTMYDKKLWIELHLKTKTLSLEKIILSVKHVGPIRQKHHGSTTYHRLWLGALKTMNTGKHVNSTRKSWSKGANVSLDAKNRVC